MEETRYGDAPLQIAQGFQDAGAEWIHLVDLDAAFGQGSNRALIEQIARAVGVRVQTGGGIRSEHDVAALLEGGAHRVIIGTAAVEQPALVPAALARWGPDRIVVGLDARGARIASRGWTQDSGADLFALGASLTSAGLQTVIYTDIARDGMLAGPNLPDSVALAERTGLQVIVSGGVRSLQDVLDAARTGPGIAGVVVGKALYEGRLDLRETVAITRAVAA